MTAAPIYGLLGIIQKVGAGHLHGIVGGTGDIGGDETELVSGDLW